MHGAEQLESLRKHKPHLGIKESSSEVIGGVEMQFSCLRGALPTAKSDIGRQASFQAAPPPPPSQLEELNNNSTLPHSNTT
jgi:hypothetical protein